MNPENQRKEKSKVLGFLETLALLLVPSVVVGLVSEFFGRPRQESAGYSIVACILIALLVFRKRLGTLVAYVSFVVGALVGVAIAIGYARVSRPGDPWAAWESGVLSETAKCSDSDDHCVASAIAKPHPVSEPSSRAQLESDLRAELALLKDPRIATVLDRRLGIKDSFLGTGIAQPLGTSDYSAGRIPEYLAPNYSDQASNVLTWELDPIAPNLTILLSSLIEKQQPGVSRTKDDLQQLRQAIKQHLDLGNQLPAMVRIQQFPRNLYSHQIGRAEAARVFTLQLGSVWTMPLQDVAKYSGYAVGPRNASAAETLFVWVVVPVYPGDVVQASWSQVVASAQSWIK